METPLTPAQIEASKAYNEACRDLAASAVNVREARAQYEQAMNAYNVAYGAARQAGVLK